MKVRIVSPGWENFTGSMGHRAMFKNGESVEPLNTRQIARIGSSIRIIDIESGQQIGPAEMSRLMQGLPLAVEKPMETGTERKAREASDREALATAEKARKKVEAEALAAAEAKAAEAKAADQEIVVYTRAELEAMAANDGIGALREIAAPLNVRARAISDMIDAILAAQAKIAVA